MRTMVSCRSIFSVVAVTGLLCPVDLAARPEPLEQAAQPAASELRVRVATAPQIVRQRGWFGDFSCATLRASDLLAVAIGRRLSVQDRVVWPAPPVDDGLGALRSHLLRTVDPGGADLVVGLVPADGWASSADVRIHDDGLAAYSQGYVVLRVGTPLCDAGRLMAHEIAHIFGGIHRHGANYLMDPSAPGTEVDEINAALFELHRDRMIRTQTPPLRGEMLRMMWRLTSADPGAATTWLRVGALAATVGRFEIACRHYERALAIEPELRTAWVNLGHARLQLEQLAAAEQAYTKALEIGTGDGLVYNNLAIVYLSRGEPRRALESMSRALELGYEVPEGLQRAIRESIQRSR